MLCGMVLLAGIATPAIAQAPLREICDQPDSGDRIKCKFGNIIEQQRGAAELLDQMGMLPPTQAEALIKHIDRAGRGQSRSDAMTFKQLTRKSKVSCQVKEILGDGKGDDDGLCSGGEDCEEVIGDQIGNDDGVCRPMNGNNREVCVEICDDDAINANPDNFDDDPNADTTGRDLEESLDDLTEQYEDINLMMAQEMSDRALDPSFQAGGSSSHATAACSKLLRGRPSSVVTAILVGAAAGARVAADVSERLCDQTAFGFSGSSVCAVVEGIAGAANVVATAYQVEGADIDSATIDAIYACLQETSTATAAAVGAVANVSGDLMAVSQQVAGVGIGVETANQRMIVLQQKANMLEAQIAETRSMLVEVISLLNTPPGRRISFSQRP
jgi:hypothetical protein